jgi:Fibronectin type III domain
VKTWARALKQWWLWLVGDSPLPGRSARLMLAGTVAVVLILAVGAAVALRSPAAPHHSASSKSGDAGSNLGTSITSTTGRRVPLPFGTATTRPGTVRDSTTTPTPTTLPLTGHGRNRGTRLHARSTTTTTATTDPAKSAVAASAIGGLALPTDPVAALVGAAAADTMVDPARTVAPSSSSSSVPSVPPPPAPMAIGATSGRGASRVSWNPDPKSANVAGYDVFVGESPGAENTIAANGASLITGKSFAVTGLTNAVTYYFVVRAVGSGGLSLPSNEVSATPGDGYQAVNTLATPVLSAAASPDGSGYFEANAQGAVSAHGAAQSEGSTDDVVLGAPIRQIVSTPSGKGYWLVAADGGVFAFGDAGYYGSMGGQAIDAPVVGMAATTDGGGYWEVSADGGVFAFGDAAFDGSMGGQPLAAPITGITASPTGGYWLVSADGGVYSFGAPFLGSASGVADHPVVGIASAPTGVGYWEVSTDGGVFNYGSAAFYGSAGGLQLAAPVVGITPDGSTGGYWMVAADGGIFSYNAPFFGAG